jgi:mRNA-degrading endonuclease RelE of RelBE toxin-antitoxin system
MTYQIELWPQVQAYYDELGMTHRRNVKVALHALREEQGDIKALGGSLTGYSRLRVGSYRLIFRYRPGRVIECVYLNHRSLVYEVFEREMVDHLHEGLARRSYRSGGATKRLTRKSSAAKVASPRRRISPSSA